MGTENPKIFHLDRLIRSIQHKAYLMVKQQKFILQDKN